MRCVRKGERTAADGGIFFSPHPKRQCQGIVRICNVSVRDIVGGDEIAKLRLDKLVNLGGGWCIILGHVE